MYNFLGFLNLLYTELKIMNMLFFSHKIACYLAVRDVYVRPTISTMYSISSNSPSYIARRLRVNNGRLEKLRHFLEVWAYILRVLRIS